MMKRLYAIFVMGAVAAACAGAPYEVLPDGVCVDTPNAKVRLQVVGDKIIRVTATPEERFADEQSLVVLPREGAVPAFAVERAEGRVTLRTSALEAVVNESDGAVTFYDPDGREILRENAGGRSFEPITVEGTRGYTVSQTFSSLNDEEGFYGLGQHQADEFNYKGRNEELFQYNTKVSVPFVVSSDNYGILWDSYSFCRWGNPSPYSPLDEIFTLCDKSGKRGCLTGTYTAADGTQLVREEPQICFEYLIRGDLNHVAGLPRDFRFDGSHVTYEGWIEPSEEGVFDFILYYSGYQTVWIDSKKVVDTRWRTAWNPNSYKFSVALRKGRRVPVKVEWEPDGGVAYCGLRACAPKPDSVRRQMRWWGEMQSQIDYYFIRGASMDEVIKGYRTLTGKAPIMPKWAMGFWQSREKYDTSREVLSTLAEFRRRGIPIDNIVIDWMHWRQDAWGSHEFDPERFPDPKAMVDSIHAMNARVMVSVWPKFYASTDHFREFDERGWMYRGAIRDSIRDWVGPGYLGSFYDAYNPEARKLFWSQIDDHYVPLGIDAWWMDASEPNIRDCIDMQYRKELMTPTYLGPSAKYFNAYALMNAEAIYNGQRGGDPDRRVFLLTRSGYAGQQRYSTATWSGDIAARWEDLAAQIAAGLNFSVSGIPYWTMDIGGFCVENRYVRAQKLFDRTGRENDDLREWRELNTRWYQFGAFVPLFRAHGQWPPREVFNIAPENHPAYKSIVRYTKLRYTLMPYIYSLCGMTYFDDYTIMRPMVMDFAADRNTLNIKDQYMFGPALLVAPVYRFGQRRREVYLPENEVWYDFYTGQSLPGGRTATVDAPYGLIPLFVRGGSILPAGGDISYAMQKSGEPLTIAVYGGRDGEFTLYEDEGVNYNYEKGRFSKIRFSYRQADNTLTVAAREGSYEGMPAARRFNIVKVDAAHPVPNAVKASGIRVDYAGEELKIEL